MVRHRERQLPFAEHRQGGPRMPELRDFRFTVSAHYADNSRIDAASFLQDPLRLEGIRDRQDEKTCAADSRGFKDAAIQRVPLNSENVPRPQRLANVQVVLD